MTLNLNLGLCWELVCGRVSEGRWFSWRGCCYFSLLLFLLFFCCCWKGSWRHFFYCYQPWRFSYGAQNSIFISIFGILIFMFNQHYYLKVLKFGYKKGCRYETRKTFTNKKFPLGRLSGELTSAALAQPNWSQPLRDKKSRRKIIRGQKRLPGSNLQDGSQDYLNYLLQSSLKSQTWKSQTTNYITVSLSSTWPISATSLV